ncbi:nucleoside monophosphate kinase [Patescibacteria group bacterium]|nr:nucleoside monophosphate kinase [Patescibacteria group bacterium]
MHKIFILGPQGSGKGTQAEILSDKLGIPALSMGQLLRDEVVAKGPLAETISSFIDKGNLVPDDLALEVLKRRLEQDDAKRGYIIDGYPRNEAQHKVFQEYDQPTTVLVITVPYDESMKRLLDRAEIEKRKDDTAELIARRLQIYEEDTRPIIEKYEKEGLVKVIDGLGSIEEVVGRIEKALGI